MSEAAKEVTFLNRFADDSIAKPRRDALRNVPLVRVGIECATKGFSELGYAIPLGYSEIVIYKDEVPKLEAMIEKNLDGLKVADQYVEDEFKEFEKTGKPSELREYENTPATFRRLNRREILPLRSVKVIAELGIPKTDEEKKLAVGNENLVEALAKVFGMIQAQQTAATAKK